MKLISEGCTSRSQLRSMQRARAAVANASKLVRIKFLQETDTCGGSTPAFECAEGIKRKDEDLQVVVLSITVWGRQRGTMICPARPHVSSNIQKASKSHTTMQHALTCRTSPLDRCEVLKPGGGMPALLVNQPAGSTIHWAYSRVSGLGYRV